MTRLRWTNPALAQTLQTAVLLLYIRAFFSTLIGLSNITAGLGAVMLVVGLAAFAAAQGTVRERRRGYLLAVVVSVLIVLLTLWSMVTEFSGWDIIGLLVDIGVVALLLHPMSRGYYRTRFR